MYKHRHDNPHDPHDVNNEKFIIYRLSQDCIILTSPGGKERNRTGKFVIGILLCVGEMIEILEVSVKQAV